MLRVVQYHHTRLPHCLVVDADSLTKQKTVEKLVMVPVAAFITAASMVLATNDLRGGKKVKPLNSVVDSYLPPMKQAKLSKATKFLNRLFQQKQESRPEILPWCGTKYYSDLVRDGLNYLEGAQDVVMVFESPSASTSCETSFTNSGKFQFFDHPLPRAPVAGRVVLGPQRYASMAGAAFSTYLQQGIPPELVNHWRSTIPDFVEPNIIHTIPPDATVCAFLPLEEYQSHVVDPEVHYHLAGKDAIPRMTSRTTQLLPDASIKPCVSKVCHSMGSRGIFVLKNDEDEAEMEQFMEQAGYPPYVLTEWVDISRNLACHFFIHPWGDFTWFGSSENASDGEGGWSADATIRVHQQEELQRLLEPYARDVAQYCLQQGYWGACGIDVLFDSDNVGYVVDVNPRVTGTSPALMTMQKLSAAASDGGGEQFQFGKFRRSGNCSYPGSAAQLVRAVKAFNKAHKDQCQVVLQSLQQVTWKKTRLNIGVYGIDEEQCDAVLNKFAQRLS